MTIEKKRSCLEFHGDSMKPLFLSGDSVFVSFNVPISNLNIGDLVFFHHDKEWILHRIVYLDKNECIIKGDYSPREEIVTLAEKVFGVVEGFKRKGFVFNWGLQGHPFKKILAFLSRKNVILNNSFFSKKYFRKAVLLLQYILIYVILTFFVNRSSENS